MENNNPITPENIVEKLLLVKDEYIKTKDELAVSIRRDIVKAELKDILSSNGTYPELKSAIEDYIAKLL